MLPFYAMFFCWHQHFFQKSAKILKTVLNLDMSNFKTRNLLKMINSLVGHIFIFLLLFFLCLLCCVFKVVFTIWVVISAITSISYFICQHNILFLALQRKNAYISINCCWKRNLFLIYNIFRENDVIMT